MKADRLPRWQFRRMNQAQREAYDRLRWHNPGPAERARLKTALGWRRSSEETVARALELLAQGRMVSAAADELEVGARYLQRLLERSQTPENRPRNPRDHAAELAVTGESGTRAPRAGGTPLCGACPDCLRRTWARLDGRQVAA